MKRFNQVTLFVFTFVIPNLLLAHEGTHSGLQTHIGDSHLGLMDVSLIVLLLVAFSAWALKEAKSNK